MANHVDTRHIYDRALESHLHAMRQSVVPDHVVLVAGALVDVLRAGKKILVCGCGGSAADAQHFVSELVWRLSAPTDRALAAIALTTDSSVMTAIANDSHFDDVYARQISALGRPGDALLAISTSGRSRSILAAAEMAARCEMIVVALTGTCGSLSGDRHHLSAKARHSVVVHHDSVARVQEVHGFVLHVIAQAIDEVFR